MLLKTSAEVDALQLLFGAPDTVKTHVFSFTDTQHFAKT